VICTSCRLAGAVLGQARGRPLPEKITAKMLAKGHHDACKAPATCGCQHRVELDRSKVVRA
jgi:hypothetical protein